MIAAFDSQKNTPDLGLNRPLIQVVRRASPPKRQPNIIRINRNRDFVRELIEENVLPDLLDTADDLLARGIPARVTFSDPDELPAHSRVAAWVKIEVYPDGGTKPVVLGFVGEVVDRGWNVAAYLMEPGQQATEGASFRGPLSELSRFTRRHLAFFSEPLVPAA
jgi:hypothetical protein